MYQPKRIQISSTWIRLFLRFFLLVLLPLGSIFSASSFHLSGHVSAQSALKTQHQDVTRFQSHPVVSAIKATTTRSHRMSQISKGRQVRPAKPLHAPAIPSVSHRSTENGNTHPFTSPDLTVFTTIPGGLNYQVGQTLTFVYTVTNTSTSTTFDANSGVALGVSFPNGFVNIIASTSNWATNISDTISPAVFASLYTGTSVGPGSTFPPITISGVLTTNAIPVFTAGPAVFKGLSQGGISGVTSVNVSSVNATPTATPTGTPTVTPTPTPINDVAVTSSVGGGPNYQVGQNITISLDVSNIDATRVLGANQSIYVGDVLPYGLDNISALGGGNWSINSSANTGPSLFTAIYIGPPVAPGGNFAPIMVTGTLTSAAAPALQNLTTVFDSQYQGSNATYFLLNVAGAPSPTPPPSLPDVSMTQTSLGNTTFQIGTTVGYALKVSSVPTSGPIGASNAVKVVMVIPVGLSAITLTAPNWSLLSTSTTSPSIIVATYQGQYPVTNGTQLPPILVQGTVLSTALPRLTTTALAQVAGDSNPNNNLTNTTIQVSPLAQTPVAPSSPTPTVVPTVTVSSVIAPLPTSLPDFSVAQASIGSGPFIAGQPLGYTITVKNASTTALPASLVRLTEIIPVGMTNVTVTAGANWHVIQSSTTSPLLISATYAGSYPIGPGVTLMPISVVGVTSNGIVSSMTCTAVVGVANDRNANNNMANNTVYITPSSPSPNSISEQRMNLIR